MIVRGPQQLARFRAGLTPAYARRLLRESGGRVLANLPVGVGKTHWLAQIARDALAADAYDVVVIAAPLLLILQEILNRLRDLGPTLLDRRPSARCGRLDRDWRSYEHRGLGTLGRSRLCRSCPALADATDPCPWPTQVRRARGARVVLAATQRLAQDTTLLRRVVNDRRALILLDEAELVTGPVSAVVTDNDLDRFAEVIDSLALPGHDDLAAWCRSLRRAGTRELREQWPLPPGAPVLALEEAGVDRFGEAFRDLTPDLRRFAVSDRASRERTPAGVRFAAAPDLPGDVMLFAATVAPGVVNYRFDPNARGPRFLAPFQGHRFSDPGTDWLNINSFEGSKRNVPGNVPAVLELFSALLSLNIRAGKRTLLVCLKEFIDRGTFAGPLADRLREFGIEGVRIVTRDWHAADYSDPRTIPLVNYGVRGLNLFEQFDAAFCLTSYLVNPRGLRERVVEFDPDVPEAACRIRIDPESRRRSADVDHPSAAFSALPNLAQGLLDMLETDVVLQAVGRVRPLTRPRQVITFQPGGLADFVDPDGYAEVRSIWQARSRYGLPNRRTRLFQQREARARALRREGRTFEEIASILAVDPRTVRRYLSV